MVAPSYQKPLKIVHKIFSPKMRWVVVMYTVHDNSTRKIDFKCVLENAHNRTCFLTNPEIERYTQAKKTNKKLIKVASATFLVVCVVRLKESTCEARKNVFISLKKLLSFMHSLVDLRLETKGSWFDSGC